MLMTPYDTLWQLLTAFDIFWKILTAFDSLHYLGTLGSSPIHPNLALLVQGRQGRQEG